MFIVYNFQYNFWWIFSLQTTVMVGSGSGKWIRIRFRNTGWMWPGVWCSNFFLKKKPKVFNICNRCGFWIRPTRWSGWFNDVSGAIAVNIILSPAIPNCPTCFILLIRNCSVANLDLTLIRVLQHCRFQSILRKQTRIHTIKIWGKAYTVRQKFTTLIQKYLHVSLLKKMFLKQ